MNIAKGNRAAIYTRISRDIQGEGLGVQRQLEDCRRLADRLGVSVLAEYSDNDISAFSGRPRPEYARLLADIEAGRIDLVLCWNIDRLLRQTKELERYMELCVPGNVATHEVTAGRVDLTTPSGRATAKTRGAWAQFESEHKADRIRRQKAQAAQAGKYLGGRVPWGWKKADAVLDEQGREHGGRIVLDAAAAVHIRGGIEAIIAGRSLVSVTRDWAAAGAVSLSGRRMNTTQVRRVLLRPRNAGLMTFHGEVVSDQWPPIVPLDSFRKCEAILTDESRPRQSEAKFKYLLSGVVRCYCGRYMTGFGAEGYRRSYRCRVHEEGGKYVPGHANRAMGPLDEYVRQIAIEWLGRPESKATMLAELQRVEDQFEPVERQDVADLINRKHSLARLFAQGAISESQLVEGSKEIEAALGNLESVAAVNGGNRALSGILLADNPGGEFLRADIEIQREVLRAVFDIDLKSSGPYRGVFDPSTLKMKPKEVAA